MTGRSAWVRLTAVTVVAGVVALACTDTLTDVEPQISVSVAPDTSRLASLGQQVQLTATVDVTTGTAPDAIWITRNVDVAAVGDDGRVRAVGNGETWIVAVAEANGVRASDSARVIVSQVPVALRIEKTLDTLTWLGQTTRLTAVAVDALGNDLLDAAFAWASTDSAMASVDAEGLVTARANGQATIAASIEGVSGAVTLAVAQQVSTVTVTPGNASIVVGATQSFTAVAADAGGTPVTGVKFLWVSANANVAVVDTLGVARATGPGQVAITAVGRGEPGNARLTVSGSAGAPTQLAFTVQPPTSVAGQAFSPAVEVEVRDAAGVRVPDARNAVTLAILNNAGVGTPGTLSGTRTITAVDGVASFSGLSIDKKGTGYTLRATATGLTEAPSSGFDITPAAPIKLAFGTQPTTVEGNVVIAPALTVTILDAFDNVTTATNQVTVAIGVNPWKSVFSPGATLGGTKTVSASNGTASFSTLRIDRPGPGYTLTATAAGLTGATSAPFPVTLTVLTTPQSFAAGFDHACAIATGGTYCWGYNGRGQLGDGTTGGLDTVPRLVSGGLSFTRIAAGVSHTCAITNAGAAYCWGYNAFGQLGDASNTLRSVPTAVATPPSAFSSITATGYHTCGVSGTSIYCWGNDGSGQLGDDAAIANKNVPTVVAGAQSWVSVTAGYNHTCGRTSTDVFCWGDDSNGQLGNNNTFASSPTPVAVRDSLGNAKTWTAVEAGIFHTCGIESGTGAGFCWGYNQYGQLGVDTTQITVGTNKGTPVTVLGGLVFTSISAGYYHTCGTTASNTYCWGRNENGQIGNGVFGTTVPSPDPNGRYPNRTLVAGSHTFVALADGLFQMCAREGSTVWCWGNNSEGDLGDGTRVNKNQPTQIIQ